MDTEHITLTLWTVVAEGATFTAQNGRKPHYTMEHTAWQQLGRPTVVRVAVEEYGHAGPIRFS